MICKSCGTEKEIESMMVAIDCACTHETLACIDTPAQSALSKFEEIKEEWNGTVCESCGKRLRVWSAEHKIR